MDLPKLRGGTGPETKLWQDLKKLMLRDGWYVVKIHGSVYQSGLPDIYAVHLQYGDRWIELKVAKNTLSPEQLTVFGRMSRHGARIYVIKDICEYPDILHRAPNWATYGTTRGKLLSPLGVGRGKIPRK